jgi:hypothetical protein
MVNTVKFMEREGSFDKKMKKFVFGLCRHWTHPNLSIFITFKNHIQAREALAKHGIGGELLRFLCVPLSLYPSDTSEWDKLACMHASIIAKGATVSSPSTPPQKETTKAHFLNSLDQGPSAESRVVVLTQLPPMADIKESMRDYYMVPNPSINLSLWADAIVQTYACEGALRAAWGKTPADTLDERRGLAILFATTNEAEVFLASGTNVFPVANHPSHLPPKHRTVLLRDQDGGSFIKANRQHNSVAQYNNHQNPPPKNSYALAVRNQSTPGPSTLAVQKVPTTQETV